MYVHAMLLQMLHWRNVYFTTLTSFKASWVGGFIEMEKLRLEQFYHKRWWYNFITKRWYHNGCKYRWQWRTLNDRHGQQQNASPSKNSVALYFKDWAPYIKEWPYYETRQWVGVGASWIISILVNYKVLLDKGVFVWTKKEIFNFLFYMTFYYVRF